MWMFPVHLKRMCILLLLDGMLSKYQWRQHGLTCHLRPVFIDFCLDDLSIDISWVLQSTTIIGLLSISLSITVTLYLIFWGASMLGAREGNGTPLQYSCLEIPWMEEPGTLQSVGSLRVGHNLATSLSLFTFMHWGRKWQPIPVFLPGESQGWGSLVWGRLWGHTELDRTEAT